jgi:IclR family transcriptional regulator, KDG regulon repressor
VHRLAVTLVAEGMLEKNPQTDKYRLGIELFRLGTLVRRRMDLPTEARPYLFELRERTHETVLLGISADADIMYVYHLESPQAIRMRSDLGARRPAFCTAVGRAIVAFQPDDAIEQILAGPLRARTGETVTDPQKIREQLQAVRRVGYAIEDEESEVGVRAIAAPVRNAAGMVVGAVGVAGPRQRLSMKVLADIAGPLLEATAAISLRLGYRA